MPRRRNPSGPVGPTGPAAPAGPVGPVGSPTKPKSKPARRILPPVAPPPPAKPARKEPAGSTGGGGLNLGSAPPPPPPKKKGRTAPLPAHTVYSAFINAHPTMKPYATSIEKWAKYYNIDPTYYANVLWLESFSEASSTKQDPATIQSSAGAVGIAQIHGPSHRGEVTPWGQTVTDQTMRNPEFSIRWGAYYLNQGIQKGYTLENVYSKWYNPGYTGEDPYVTYQKFAGTTSKKAGAPGYVPPATGYTPQEKAQNFVEEQNARKSLSDPYITVNSKGQVVPATSADQLIYSNQGVPLTQHQWIALKGGYFDPLSQSYRNRNATNAEVARYLRSGVSEYALKNAWASQPGFLTSPLYKQQAPGYEAAWHGIYGPNVKPDSKLIARQIALGRSPSDYAEVIRQLPGYEKSHEFRQNEAGLRSVYTGIYGPLASDEQLIEREAKAGMSQLEFEQFLKKRPDYVNSQDFKARAADISAAYQVVMGQNASNPKLIQRVTAAGWTPQQFENYLRGQPAYTRGQEFKQKASGLAGVYTTLYGTVNPHANQLIKEAAASGWTPDEFAQYLRAQPGYSTSTEYQTKMLSMLDELGLITGGTATLQQGKPQPFKSGQPAQPPPASPLVPGRARAPQPAGGLVPSYGT